MAKEPTKLPGIMPMLKHLVSYLVPDWKTVSRRRIKCTHVSALLGGREWTTTDVLEIQENSRGDKRAFIVSEYGKREVNYHYIMTLLEVE